MHATYQHGDPGSAYDNKIHEVQLGYRVRESTKIFLEKSEVRMTRFARDTARTQLYRRDRYRGRGRGSVRRWGVRPSHEIKCRPRPDTFVIWREENNDYMKSATMQH